MGSRSERATALRRFASHLRDELDKVQLGLANLRMALITAEMDEEDRAAYQDEFESAATMLNGTIDGAWEAQHGRLFALADALEALEYGGSAPASSAPAGQPAAARGSSGQPEGWKDGVHHADPDRRENKPRMMR